MAPSFLAFLTSLNVPGGHNIEDLAGGETQEVSLPLGNASPAVTPVSLPSAPQNLIAVSGDRRIDLSWQPPSSDGGVPITGYRLYHGVYSGDMHFYLDLGNVLEYTDTSIGFGYTFYYQIAAFNTAGEGPRSNEASAISGSLPSQPLYFVANRENAKVKLSWQDQVVDGVSPAIGYRLYRGVSSGAESLLIELGNILTYTDTDLTNGMTYYYQVSAASVAGEGPRSDEVSATPIDSPWMNMNPATGPLDRADHMMAYDAQSDRAVLFGGRGGTGNPYLDDTWTYDLNTNTWTDMYPATSPYIRADAAMAYDSESDRTILFGGYGGSYWLWGDYGDTWAYDFDTNSWTDMNPVTSPSSRHSSAMAYDAQSDRIILFGGFNKDYGYYCDGTWAYDFDTNTWTNMNPATHPSLRFSHSMAYDAQSDRVILFGGWDYDHGYINDTWSYDYDTNTWMNINPATSPSARDGHGMAYDVQSDRITLFGGEEYLHGPCDDTWSYDYEANTWTNMDPPWSPSGRYDLAMVYDAQSDRIVIFGGQNSIEGTCQYQYPPAHPSSPRAFHANPADSLVELAWEAPSLNGGSVITNYTIYRGAASGILALLTTVGDVLSYTDTGLTNGDTYYYQISAANAVGEGPRSGEISVTPITTSSAPHGFSATSGDARVDLSWEEPYSNGGSSVIGYRIYRSSASGAETLLVEIGNSLTYTDIAVANSITYYYLVCAVNAAGEGSPSAEVSATPLRPNTSPTATFTASPSSGDMTTTFTVDASASSDSEDVSAVLKVRWDWEDDDVWDTSWSTSKIAYHQYVALGTFTIVLEIRDTGGLSSSVTNQVTVTADSTKPTPSAGADQTIDEDTVVAFDGSTSTDNIGVTAYAWTFTDVIIKTLSGSKPTYTFSTPGVYTVTMNVSDAAGNWAVDTVVITVEDVTKPVADAGQNRTTTVGLAVNFDASASSDNVGIVSYEWDFGDGTGAMSETTNHVYASKGTYTVVLTVKDAAGNVGTASLTVTVSQKGSTSSTLVFVGIAVAAAAAVAVVALLLQRRK
jgi:PKD repeat protein/fibronectin type 3 domain-containing protein